MAWLKGQRVGDYVEIASKVNFKNTVLATGAMYTAPYSDVFYVDGVDGLDTGNGTSPTTALKTIAAAVAKCGRGDIVYIRPLAFTAASGFDRYIETIEIPFIANDLSLIGITNSINPDFGPKLRYATTGYILDVKAAALHVENLGFLKGGTATDCVRLRNDGASNVMRGTDGATFHNCTFKYGGIRVEDGGDGIVVSDVTFTNAVGCLTTAAPTSPSRRFRIVNSRFLDNDGAAVATAYIAFAGFTTGLVMDNCKFGIIPTAGKFLTFADTSAGLISNCYFNDPDVHLTTDLTLAGILLAGCYDNSNALIA